MASHRPTIRRAIVVGAGPGGLTAAIALGRIGIDVEVYEQASERPKGGSGLTLWPNALNALDQILLGDQIRALGQALDGIAMLRCTGERLFDIPSKLIEGQFGECGVALFRADLVAALLRAISIETVHWGVRCVSVMQDDEGVTAVFQDGTTARGELLIGADGIRSITRAQVLGGRKLTYAGYAVSRGIAQYQVERSVGMMSLGCGAQFGLFALRNGQTYWFAATNSREFNKNTTIASKEQLLFGFASWHDPIPLVIAATAETSILTDGVYEMCPMDCWTNRRVTLLGDAAHPFAPTLGQGACQAIEDAVVLGKCLQTDGDLRRALEQYEAQRRPRTKAIARQSQWTGRVGQIADPTMCRLRDWLVKSTPGFIRAGQLRWLFQFDG